MNKNKIGLALGGGGAKGAYQIGVIRALEEENLMDIFKYVSGTSIGSINTLLLMTGKDHLQMLDMWKYIQNENIYGPGMQRPSEDKPGLYDLKPLFETLIKKIDIDSIRNSKYQGYATAAEVKKNSLIHQLYTKEMTRYVFHLNTFNKPFHAVLASSSIPLLFGTTTIDDNVYVDGGLLDNHAIEPLIEKGCEVVFSVPLDRFLKVDKYKDRIKLLIDFTSKTAFHRTMPLDLIDAMRFERDRISERFFYGYHVAKRVIQKLKDMHILGNNNILTVPLGFTHVTLTKEEDKEIELYIKEIMNYES